MSVIWERFAGQTDIFAIRLTLISDPHAGEAAAPAESASWGSLQLWARGQNLCAHIDQGEMLGSVHWYLLPLLEWVAENWNPLLHEEKLPNRNSGATAADGLRASRLAPSVVSEPEIESWEQEWFDWRSRHAIRAARSGGLFPNVLVRRVRDYIEVSWNSEQDAGVPPGFGFTAGVGSALFDPVDVAAPLHHVVNAAARFIRGIDADHERLDEVLRRLDAVATPSRQHADRLRWMAGVRSRADGRSSDQCGGDVEDHWDLVVRSLEELASPGAFRAALDADESELVTTGSSQASLLFSSVAPTVTSKDVRTLSSILVDQFRDQVDAGVLDLLSRRVPIDVDIPAWEHGYELAEDLHAELDLDISRGWVDIETLVRDLGVDVVERELVDLGIRACSLIGPHHRPTIVHNSTSPFGSNVARRFTLAHELCHLLYDRGRGANIAIASGPWAPRSVEQRANAFAAMFLMPNDLIKSHVSGSNVPVGSHEGVARLGSIMRVSRRAVIEHLYNLNLATEPERDDLLGRVVD